MYYMDSVRLIQYTVVPIFLSLIPILITNTKPKPECGLCSTHFSDFLKIQMDRHLSLQIKANKEKGRKSVKSQRVLQANTSQALPGNGLSTWKSRGSMQIKYAGYTLKGGKEEA